jgi:hypothetical protein
MRKRVRCARGTALLVVALLLGWVSSACAEAEETPAGSPPVASEPAGAAPPGASDPVARAEPPAFETPPVLKAGDVLPAALRKGADFRVAPDVHNDGFLNRYQLKTTWGELEVVSTALLRKRVRETAAIRQLEDMGKSEEFAKSVGDAGQGAVRGAVSLVTHPVDTVSSAASGVGKVFGMAKKSITSDEGSDAEDDHWKQVVGYSQTKRDLAKELGVDVYSQNPQLQKALDDMTWAGWSGGMTGGLALAVIPGGVGVAVSVSKNTDLFQRIDVTRPPGTIRDDNRRKLAALGIPSASIDRFIGDSTLSPTEQSVIVVNLEDMEGAEGRAAFVDYAAHAPDRDMASFVVLQSAMYARYHHDEEPIARFEGLGPRLVARTGDGSAVVIHPMDRLYWTEAAGGILASVRSRLGDAPHKRIWVGGSASDRAREALKGDGWELREGVLAELVGD